MHLEATWQWVHTYETRNQQIPVHNHNLGKASAVTEMTLTLLLCFPLKCTCSHSQISLPKLLGQAEPCAVSKEEHSQKPKIVHAVNMLNHSAAIQGKC